MPPAPVLPAGLPVPQDDGAAAHLTGLALPPVSLPGTGGSPVRLDALGAGRTVLYVYPMMARPGTETPPGWDAIPGVRGCTAQACDFRDHHADLREAGAAHVYGLSAQSAADQRDLAELWHLPFALLSDAGLALRDAVTLPTFEAGGVTLYRRLTMIVSGGVVERVFYPVFPPDRHAAEVVAWLRAHPA